MEEDTKIQENLGRYKIQENLGKYKIQENLGENPKCNHSIVSITI